MEVSNTEGIIIFSIMMFTLIGIPIFSCIWYDMGGKEAIGRIRIRMRYINTKTTFDILELKYTNKPTYVVRVMKYYWFGLIKRTYYLGHGNLLFRSIDEAKGITHDKSFDRNQFLYELKNEVRSVLRLEPERGGLSYDVVYSHGDSKFDHRRAADIISELRDLDDVKDQTKIDQLLEELNRISK